MAIDWTKSETTYVGDAPDKPRPPIAGSEAWGVDDVYTAHPFPDPRKIQLARPSLTFPGTGWDTSPDVKDVLSGRALAESPFLGREFLRRSVAEMLSDDGPEVLVVNGPRGSGKSFTWQSSDRSRNERRTSG